MQWSPRSSINATRAALQPRRGRNLDPTGTGAVTYGVAPAAVVGESIRGRLSPGPPPLPGACRTMKQRARSLRRGASPIPGGSVGAPSGASGDGLAATFLRPLTTTRELDTPRPRRAGPTRREPVGPRAAQPDLCPPSRLQRPMVVRTIRAVTAAARSRPVPTCPRGGSPRSSGRASRYRAQAAALPVALLGARSSPPATTRGGRGGQRRAPRSSAMDATRGTGTRRLARRCWPPRSPQHTNPREGACTRAMPRTLWAAAS